MDETRIRLHSLDAMRGIAALAVVCQHWQHMQLLDSPRTTWWPRIEELNHRLQPLYPLLRVFYERGYIAVDFFFLISGFIFFWLYRDALATRSMSYTSFAVLRFSRLYPLHLVTLIIVAVLQWRFVTMIGQYFVYAPNDWWHFLLSLLFIQLPNGESAFNGPEWSLSVELVIYAVFCVLARTGRLKGPLWPVLMILAGAAVAWPMESISRGMCGFFVGGLTYMIFEVLRNRWTNRKPIWILTCATVAGWVVVICDVYLDGALSSAIESHLPIAKKTIVLYSTLYGLFPITILLAALHENVSGASYKSIAWLGEISYSSYLLHFPLQLLVACVVGAGLMTAQFARSGPCMAIYLATLIPVSLFVFRWFEAPMQSLLRRRWQSVVGVTLRRSSPALR